MEFGSPRSSPPAGTLDRRERVDEELADVQRLLLAARARVATAESLTGGRLAALFTRLPGSSAVYDGGVVSYATRVKEEVLGVPGSLVAAHGVISAECARAMAQGARDLMGTGYALATTGVAGPDLQEGQPVGTVFIGLAGPAGTRAIRIALAGDRLEIAEQACLAAVSLLRTELADATQVPSAEPE